jgi:hypothetical protein
MLTDTNKIIIKTYIIKNNNIIGVLFILLIELVGQTLEFILYKRMSYSYSK